MEEQILSVSAVNRIVQDSIDSDRRLQGIYMRGEISNYKLYPSGHHYFTLKDAESSMRCVMFRSAATKLRFRPDNGMKVIVCGKVSVFLRDGAYQFYCDRLNADGIGDLHVAFEQLKAKLYAEGLFDPAHKKLLPRYPERVAIITSSAGAAVHDMIRIMRKRYPSAKILLLPVRVQGTEAPPEIVGALRYANAQQLADVIITGRGGGSIEDLWAFNDERVARAIYASAIPVVSAVGHEPDVTIADFVADVRAATPSHAAEIVVPDSAELLYWIRTAGKRMEQSLWMRLRKLRERLSLVRAKRVLHEPSAVLADRQLLLDHMLLRLHTAAQRAIAGKRERCGTLCAALDALSPLKVLRRGYAIAQREDGTVLRRASELTTGDRIDVILERGEIRALVEEIGKGAKNRGKDI